MSRDDIQGLLEFFDSSDVIIWRGQRVLTLVIAIIIWREEHRWPHQTFSDSEWRVERSSEDWMMIERTVVMNWWHVLLMPGLKYKNNCANFLISHCLQLIKTFGGIFRSFTLIARVAKCSQGGEMNSRWLERSLRRVSPGVAIAGLWLAPESGYSLVIGCWLAEGTQAGSSEECAE